MTTEDIMSYVLESPENTNPAVLRDMLNQLDTGNGGNIPDTFTWILSEKADFSCESNMTIAELCAYVINNTVITCQFTSKIQSGADGSYDVEVSLYNGTATLTRPNQSQDIYIKTPLYGGDLTSTDKFAVYYG